MQTLVDFLFFPVLLALVELRSGKPCTACKRPKELAYMHIELHWTHLPRDLQMSKVKDFDTQNGYPDEHD